MAENSNDPQSARERFNETVRSDSDEVQDWINGNGAMVLGAIVVFIALYAVYALVFS